MNLDLPLSTRHITIVDALNRELFDVDVAHHVFTSEDVELAKFIVLAVNHHDALVNALYGLLDILDRDALGYPRSYEEIKAHREAAKNLLLEVEKQP